MPLFGARMVCETANVKHIEKHKKEMLERETKLGEWEKEKAERIDKLRERSNSLAAAIQAHSDAIEKVRASSCSDHQLMRSPPKTNPIPQINLERHSHLRMHRSGSIATSTPSTSQLADGFRAMQLQVSPKSPMESHVFNFDPIETPPGPYRGPSSYPTSASGSRGHSGASSPCFHLSPLKEMIPKSAFRDKTPPTSPCSSRKNSAS
ncbi:uncharacterized protein LOC131886153 [Tigriopus californicus]|uniref:uncharacterized protein LOC131886153 n=1 Tax=Tigriopus californicus TaxID=6832 RepID=UPI0027DA102C|nr:uncharacterized protein LOC131886153 [Tigriopus californicus]